MVNYLTVWMYFLILVAGLTPTWKASLLVFGIVILIAVARFIWKWRIEESEDEIKRRMYNKKAR